MKTPSNIIVKNQYTIGKEFIYSDTYENYQGYYYEINSRYFIGKVFNPNAREILKLNSDKVDRLRLNSLTSIFGKLSKVKLSNNKLSSFIYTGKNSIRYFAKKLNNNPILIKEIDKNTFDSIQQDDPIYQTISIKFPIGGYFEGQKSLDEAEKKMPGIKTFILSDLPPD
jgi:hypothetical protein